MIGGRGEDKVGEAKTKTELKRDAPDERVLKMRPECCCCGIVGRSGGGGQIYTRHWADDWGRNHHNAEWAVSAGSLFHSEKASPFSPGQNDQRDAKTTRNPHAAAPGQAMIHPGSARPASFYGGGVALGLARARLCGVRVGLAPSLCAEYYSLRFKRKTRPLISF